MTPGSRSRSRATRTGRARVTTSGTSSTASKSSRATGCGPTTPPSWAGSAGSTAAPCSSSATRRAGRSTSRSCTAWAWPSPRATARPSGCSSSPSGTGSRCSRSSTRRAPTPGWPPKRAGRRAPSPRRCSRMARLTVPVVATVIGEGGSGGALALAVADRVLMQENATYSVITPEGCAAILWRDAAFAPQAAEALKPTASAAARAGRRGARDRGAARAAPTTTRRPPPPSVGEAITEALAELDAIPPARASPPAPRALPPARSLGRPGCAAGDDVAVRRRAGRALAARRRALVPPFDLT